MDAPRRNQLVTALALAGVLSAGLAIAAPDATDAPVVAAPLHVSAQVPVVKTGEAHLLHARWAAAVAAAGHYVYIVGGDAGWSGPSLRSIERFDVRTGHPQEFAELKQARRHFGAIIVDDKLYAIGGTVQKDRCDELPEFPDFTRPEDRPRGLPFDYQQGTRLSDQHRSPESDLPLLDSVEVVDLKTGQVTAGPPMPEARAAFGCVVVGRKISVIGGLREAGLTRKYTNRSLVLDLDTQRWSEGVPMPQPAETAAVKVDDFIVVAGGYDSVRQFATVYAFSPTVQRWRGLPPLVKPVGAHAMVFFGHHLLLFGSYRRPEELIGYDLVTKTSEAFTLSYTPLRHAAAAMLDGKIYVIGGKSDERVDPSDLVQIFEAPPKLAKL